MNRDALASHLQVKTYGGFTLTDAIRPAPAVPVRPRQGFRVQVFRDPARRVRMPMLSAAVSAEILFDTFVELLAPLGEDVHVVVESSHGSRADRHQDYRRDNIDAPILASYCYEFEELLVNDGCTGMAVLSSRGPMEVQFDEHKLLHVYAPDLTPFRNILRGLGVRRRKDLPLISEAEHLHHSSDAYADEFQQLCVRLGVGDFDAVFSDESY